MLPGITYRDLQSEQNAGGMHREVGVLQGKKATECTKRESKTDSLMPRESTSIKASFKSSDHF